MALVNIVGGKLVSHLGTAIGKTLIVFHFCASYDDYAAMEGVMRYMLRSVEPVGDK